jgi:hypothetical protein
MLQYGIGTHWHVVMSHVELVDGVELAGVKTHSSHVILGDVHFV